MKAPLYGELQVCKYFTSALYFYEFVFPGKLVCVQGTVVRAGNIRPLVTRIAFQCLSCHSTQVSPLSSFPSSPPVHTYIRTYLITWYHLKQVFLDANFVVLNAAVKCWKKQTCCTVGVCIYVCTCPGVESTGRQVHSPSLVSGTGMQGKTVLSAEDLSTDSYR